MRELLDCPGSPASNTLILFRALVSVIDRSLLSKTEIQFLQGKKQVSKSYEYKLKSIIKKKLAILIDKELPLLISLFPNPLDLTKFSKIKLVNNVSYGLTKNSKESATNESANLPTNRRNHENSTSFANDKLYIKRGGP